MTPEERKLAKERYLKALEDPASGITLETPAGLIEGTVQQRWGQAAQEGVERASKLTNTQALAQARRNSGWTPTWQAQRDAQRAESTRAPSKAMKIDLTICGVHELPDQQGKPWTHVVSIWDKVSLNDIACREQVRAVAPSAKLHFSFFDDVSDPSHPAAPCLLDVVRILAFTKRLSAGAKVLVHCRAGVSRSTATAYAILCQHSPLGMEMKNLLHVQSLRVLVLPNPLIIELADEVLQRNGGMLLRLEHPTALRTGSAGKNKGSTENAPS